MSVIVLHQEDMVIATGMDLIRILKFGSNLSE